MHGKGHIVNDLLATTNYSIIACAETHFRSKTDINPFVAGTDFLCARVDRKSHGGGFAIFHRKNLNFQPLTLPPMQQIEAVAVVNNEILLCAIYWPPQTYNPSCADLDALLECINVYKANRSCILVGDLNLSGVGWSFFYDEQPTLIPDVTNTRIVEREAIAYLHLSQMHQINSSPINRGKFLDLLFVSDIEKVFLTVVEEDHSVLAPTEHHVPVAFNFRNRVDQIKPKTRTVNKVNHRKLDELLAKIPLSFVPSKAEVQSHLNLIKEAVSTSTTSIEVKVRDYGAKHPWLIGCAKYRDLRKSIQSASRAGDRNLVKSFSTELRKLYATLKANYCRENLNSDGSPIDLFNFVKFTKNNQDIPEKMTYNGNRVGDVMSAFEDHLSRAFEDITEPLYDESQPINEKLRTLWETHYHPDPQFVDTISFHPSEVYEAIMQINPKKDAGRMKLHPSVFTEHAERMTDILTPFYNACSLIQWIPPEGMQTTLIPVPKTGSRKEVTNYRGIALSNIICKIMDKIITAKMSQNFDDKINNSQYGFRPNRSTVGCTFDAAQFIAQNMNWCGRVDAVFLDISKAFDRLSHTSIAVSLSKAGMPLRQLQFIMHFIYTRQYFVRVNGVSSNEAIIPDGGVPQGSHCGPTLFILVADSICRHIRPSTKMYQYADEILLAQPIKDGSDEDELQLFLRGISDWCNESGLRINKEKSKVLKFTRRQPDNLTSYEVEGVALPEVDDIRYLGIIFDRKLSFNKQSSVLRERTTRLTYAAARLCTYLRNKKLCMRLYQIYIEPIILFGAATWACRTNKMMTAISYAHRIATRTAMGTAMRPHLPNYMMYEDRCAHLKLLTTVQRISQFVIVSARRFADNLTYTENSANVVTAIHIPDDSRRFPLPLINVTVRRQHASTPLGYLLTVVNTAEIEYHEWMGTIHNLKEKSRESVLLHC